MMNSVKLMLQEVFLLHIYLKNDHAKTGGALSELLNEQRWDIVVSICGKRVDLLTISAGTLIMFDPENSGNINCKAAQ